MAKSRLQEELKKRNPFESPQEEALLNLFRTHDEFTNQFAKFFRDFQITGPQYNVLRILRGEGKPLPSLEIASRLLQKVPGITGLIDRLEKRGFVQRSRCQEDRRVVYVAITDDGLKILKEIDPVLVSANEKVLGHMSTNELKTLSSLLEKAREPHGS